ncbi:leucine-rich repeats and immunoglobulin-like domains protein 1 isoform X2 [Microcaecilia unicolor]|uniref:leucine-rich repeats and immunoglobulin-like domains protein 1 isoform X2 n=1 Tax=Microcaecilia unicolor TaxID=1415580 RepID=UPI00118557CF|nr:leucine-rich repeats and immunoglobulin-like domains protein 1 isoform X2 [Microcaecilia unicolor]
MPAAPLARTGLPPLSLLSSAAVLQVLLGSAFAAVLPPSPAGCSGTDQLVNCSHRGLSRVPADLPIGAVSIDLSHNKLTEVDPAAFEGMPNLREVTFSYNELTAIPSLGSESSHVVALFLHHNKIRSVEPSQLEPYISLETLDLSSNEITAIRNGCFPFGLPIKELRLGRNRITTLEPGAFNILSRSLVILRLNRNKISQLSAKTFKLPNLIQLELNWNRIRLIEGLTFLGLDKLEVLKLQHNSIYKLTDGAFWGLGKMQSLHLEYNNLTEVDKGSLFGLSSLLRFHLGNNSITRINPDGWRFCEKLNELILSYNNFTRLNAGGLASLGGLDILRLSHNSISHVAEGAFKGLKNLRILELDHNEISGTIEDTSAAFTGLDSLTKLTLFGNKIKSVAKKAFSGLEALEHLNLGENAIRSVQFDTFAPMKNLKELHISSDSFLCDCMLMWLPEWLTTRGLETSVVATCAHPESLKNKSIFSVPPENFVCDDVPKPQIIIQPETTVGVLDEDISFTCSAASSSSSPMTFTWKKDNEVLPNPEIENLAHVRAKDGDVTEYTTILHLRHVTFAHEGRYQCIISNHFGATYSSKAQLTVNVLPSFTKTPNDISVRTGTVARLECAARGYPTPEISWQKDGGTDFPAARERRMHVMPDDDVLFIMEVKLEDMGVYSCTAENSAGSVSANASLNVLETPSLVYPLEDHLVIAGATVALQCKATGSPPPRISWLKGDEPLIVTERHHFTAGNQLLVIRNVVPEDAGKYTCKMSNTLGTERAHSQMIVSPVLGYVAEKAKTDSTMTVAIITVVVVCSIVLTSVVWVCIIYQTRKKNEEYNMTNTDETIEPPDVPNYLCSHGTLFKRQKAVRANFTTRQQPNGHIESNGMCKTDNVGYPSVEIQAASCIEPQLCIECSTNCIYKTEDTANGELIPGKTEYSLPVLSRACNDSTPTGQEHHHLQTFKPMESFYQKTLNGDVGREGATILKPQLCNEDVCCNGTDSPGSVHPSNHDRMRELSPVQAQALHSDRRDSSSLPLITSSEFKEIMRFSSSEGSVQQPATSLEISNTLLDPLRKIISKQTSLL